MKKFSLLGIFALLISYQSAKLQEIKTNLVKDKIEKDASDRTNDFYDNENTYLLPHSMRVEVSGEVANPGTKDLSKLPLHSVIVKETLPSENGAEFIGSYRYDGYSLYDILNEYVLAKKNADQFNPIIDLYVEVENDKGDKAVISWGELYYPVHLHEIIIATKVMQIVPSKTKDYWPLPQESKLIIASDLLTCRNISNPVKITVKSLDKNFVVNRNLNPLWSDQFSISVNGIKEETYADLPNGLPDYIYPNIFYGRGKGIHKVTPFAGHALNSLLNPFVKLNDESLKRGMVTIAGIDGYRAAFTLSEIMNRNDQSEVLIIERKKPDDGGKFSVFPASDFFSDRAIKGISEIHIDLDK